MIKCTALLRNTFTLFELPTSVLIQTYEMLENNDSFTMTSKDGNVLCVEGIQILSILATRKDPEAKEFLSKTKSNIPNSLIRNKFNLDAKEEIFDRKEFILS